MLGFATYRFSIVISQSQYQKRQEIFEYYFDGDDKLGKKDGFAVAAAITRYDDDPEPIEDESIGTV